MAVDVSELARRAAEKIVTKHENGVHYETNETFHEVVGDVHALILVAMQPLVEERDGLEAATGAMRTAASNTANFLDRVIELKPKTHQPTLDAVKLAATGELKELRAALLPTAGVALLERLAKAEADTKRLQAFHMAAEAYILRLRQIVYSGVDFIKAQAGIEITAMDLAGKLQEARAAIAGKDSHA